MALSGHLDDDRSRPLLTHSGHWGRPL